MNKEPEFIGTKPSLSPEFEQELRNKEKDFCSLLSLDHPIYLKAIPDFKARNGLMTLYDFYKTKLKVFHKTPKYFRRLEWGIKYHFLGTAKAAAGLASAMELSDIEAHELVIAGFFHDIAKIRYDNDFFIRKLSRPDNRILQHSTESFGILVTYCGYFNNAILMGILQHHESFDGNGYPLGLKGDQIHIYARAIAVVDAYSAMMETREFSSKKETVSDVLEEIHACKYMQFDPDIADIFIKSKPGSLKRKV